MPVNRSPLASMPPQTRSSVADGAKGTEDDQDPPVFNLFDPKSTEMSEEEKAAMAAAKAADKDTVGPVEKLLLEGERLSKDLHALAGRVDVNVGKDSKSALLTERFQKELKRLSKAFDALHKKMLDKAKSDKDHDSIYDWKHEFSVVMDDCLENVGTLKERHSTTERKRADSLTSEASSASLVGSEMLDAIRAMQLPPLEIEPFDGSITRFREFMDAFNANFHENQALSMAQKLSQLKHFTYYWRSP